MSTRTKALEQLRRAGFLDRDDKQARVLKTFVLTMVGEHDELMRRLGRWHRLRWELRRLLGR